MKEFLIATTAMITVAAVNPPAPKDSLKVMPNKKAVKKTEKKCSEQTDETSFSLFNFTFKFQ